MTVHGLLVACRLAQATASDRRRKILCAISCAYRMRKVDLKAR